VPGGSLVEVEAVADREDQEPGGDEAPGAVGSPARDRQRPHDHPDQGQVEERVGDVRRDRRSGRPVDRAEDGREDDRGADRADGETADHAVEPEARAKLAHA
jgi:hypothetical protein